MANPLAAFVPLDRRHQLPGRSYPDRTRGTVLFADLSGFTPMTQLLVEKFGSRRGAELLTDQLDRIYGALIREVHRFRGSVSTFSGDAITAFFDDETGVNGVGCGLALQEVMARLRKGGLADGQLAIKVGIAAGDLRRFIVGDPDVQIFDVLAGRLLDRMAAAEKHSGPGEVVVDQSVAVTLGARLICGERRGRAETPFYPVQALACPALPTPWPGDCGLETAQLRPWVAMPLRERLEIGSSLAVAELRVCVALFVQFAGLDFDNDDSAGTKLDAYVRWVQAVVTAHEGLLVDIITGDKGCYLYVAFGALNAHRDDPVRAVSAAAQLVLPPAIFGDLGDTRIGINQGRMRVGPYGSPERRTYGVLGSPVNIAARLMTAARVGQVLLSAGLAQAAQDRFEFQALSPVKVKGLTAPLEVAELRGRRITAARSRHAPASLVGRHGERVVIEEALAATATGERRVLVIEGEAGIGKSRMAAYAVARAGEQRVGLLVGNGDPLEQGTPFAPWRSVLVHALGIAELTGEARCARVLAQLQLFDPLGGDAALLNTLLGLELPEPPALAALTPAERAVRTTDCIVTLLDGVLWPGGPDQGLDRGCPAARLLLIEDAHWLDSLSWNLLAEAAVRIRSLLCVMTTRPLEAPLPRAFSKLALLPSTVRLPLSSLSPEEATELAGRRLGVDTLPPEVAALISARAGGNPFFSEELALALRDSGRIRVEEGRCTITTSGRLTDEDLPDTVEGAIAERIDRLPLQRQLALKVASIFGRVFSRQGLEELYPAKENRSHLTTDLDALSALSIILLETPDPGLYYAFKHIITQQVAYNQILFQQRRSLHRHAALWTERLHAANLVPVYELLVHHFRAAEEPQRTLYYLKLAGDEASRLSAYVEAVAFYQEALLLFAKLPDRDPLVELRLQIALGPALMATKGWGAQELEQTYARARALCQQVGQEAEIHPELCAVLWGLWRFYLMRGQNQTAREQAEQCLRLAQRIDTKALLVVAYTALGFSLYAMGEPLAAMAHLEQGIAVYSPEQHRGLAVRHGIDLGVWSLCYAAWCRWTLGYSEHAVARMDEALTLARKLDHPFTLAAALFYASVLHFFRRDFPSTQDRAEACVALARDKGFPQFVNVGTATRSWALTLQGRGQDATCQIEKTLATFRLLGQELDRPRFLAMLAEVHGHLGQIEQGLAVVAEGLLVMERTRECWWAPELHRLKGELLLALADRQEEAAGCFRQAIEVAHRQQARLLQLRAAVSLSRLWQKQARREEARALLVESYAFFTEGFATADLSAAGALLAELS